MWAQLPPKERYSYLGLVCVGLAALTFVGARALERPAEVRILGAEPKPVLGVKGDSGGVPVESGEVVVHVVGAVAKPGVVKLPKGSRVSDAIRAAGGATKNASLDELNLAALLIDGSQIDVPLRGEPPAPAAEGPYSRGTAPAYTSKSKSSDSKARGGALQPGSISLNTGSKADFDRLPGVGPATAAKMIEYRVATGGYSSIDELLQVKGIGPKKLAAMRKYLRL